MSTTIAPATVRVPTPKRASLFRRFLPATLEQSIGLAYLFMAITLIPRPFLAGLTNLQSAYNLPHFSIPLVGAVLALFGGILILLRRASRRQFALLFAPLPIYALALSLFCVQNPFVGAAGALGYWALTICVAWMYHRRATQREHGVGEFA